MIPKTEPEIGKNDMIGVIVHAFVKMTWDPAALPMETMEKEPSPSLPSWISLFVKFLKLGATAYGGPAIAGQMKKTFIKEYRWISEEDFNRGLALCQLIPGATWVQMAAYVGYRLRGIHGAAAGAAAFVIPSFLFVLALSIPYFRWGDLWFIQALFRGLGAIVVAIVLDAFLQFGKPHLKNWKMVLIILLSFFGFYLRLNILLVFMVSAFAAFLIKPEIRKSPLAGIGGNHSSPGGMRKDALFLVGLAAALGILYALCFFAHPTLFYLSLALSKIGVLSFGGGMTSISLIQYEVVDRFDWFTTKELLDGIAMGQVTPGPIMITAAFLGYKLSGFWGAFAATLAIFSPAFFILSLTVPYYDRLRGFSTIRMAEQGVLASFVGMIGIVLLNFGRTAIVDPPSVLLAAGAFISLLKKIDLAFILIPGAILSILIFGFFL